ncbi:hypothetical protein EYC84_010704 [Monilinia fructicola]|uniref:Uncharacterized protein n=1 Tax=Monilinia fructicola TaxID=38448 RepID=A0A5M9J640_MONFR|nr:hypothetical protein EYC84_010704 [Monilinia fructicola]
MGATTVSIGAEDNIDGSRCHSIARSSSRSNLDNLCILDHFLSGSCQVNAPNPPVSDLEPRSLAKLVLVVQPCNKWDLHV